MCEGVKRNSEMVVGGVEAIRSMEVGDPMSKKSLLVGTVKLVGR